MKKKIILLTCGSLLTLSIVASTIVISKMIVNADSPNKLLVPEYTYFENFDNYQNNEEWSHNVFSLDFSSASVVSENAIKGKSLKLDIPHKNNWGSMNFKSEMLNLKNSDYHIEFSCKTENIDSIDVPILKNFDGEYFAQYGVRIKNDDAGKPTNLYFRYGASLIKEENVLNHKRELKDGVISIGFDFSVGDQISYPSICFHSTKDHAIAIIDNIMISDKNNPGEYYDIQYKDDFNSIPGNDVFNTTPFWLHTVGTMDFVTSQELNLQHFLIQSIIILTI